MRRKQINVIVITQKKLHH